jgi:hypothetical protein
MAGFNFPSGSPDPNSLPALLHQKMAPGLIPGPVQPLPITSGFRVPTGVGMPGLSMPTPQPGFSAQDGAKILSTALSNWKRNPSSGGILNLSASPPAGLIGAPPGLPDPSDGLSGWGASQSMDPLTGLLQDLGFGGGIETGGVAEGSSLLSSLDPAGLFSGVAGLLGGGAAAGGAAAGAGDAAAAAGAGAAGAEAAGFSIADLLPFLAVLAA